MRHACPYNYGLYGHGACDTHAHARVQPLLQDRWMGMRICMDVCTENSYRRTPVSRRTRMLYAGHNYKGTRVSCAITIQACIQTLVYMHAGMRKEADVGRCGCP